MPMAMMVVVFMCFFVVYTFRRDMLEYQYEQIDSDITYSLLASAAVNLEEYAMTGNLIIADEKEPDVRDGAFLKAYLTFVDCLKCNMALDDNMQVKADAGMSGTVQIVSYIIYNYIVDENGCHITECGITDGQPYTIRHADDRSVSVHANGGIVNIEETSVYAEIRFNIEGIGEYSLKRLVAVTDAEGGG